MKNRLLGSGAAAALVLGTVLIATPTLARDQISIVGSSTVFPFSTTVADKFGKKTKFKTPKVISTGSGGGMKLFCKGSGIDTPDITNASRRMKAKEWKKCQAAGVKNITEVVIGYDGIVLANAKAAPTFVLTRKQIYMAVAAMVPGKDGKLVKNPYKKWSDIDPSLPDIKIEVFGPPPTSGTRDAFEEIAMGKGAQKFKWLKTLRGLKKGDTKIAELAKMHAIPAEFLLKKGKPTKGKNIFKKIAHHIREDGNYIEAGENDNAIVGQLEANTKAIGVFGFSYLDQNKARIKGAQVNGEMPTFEKIASGAYPISRSLYFYVKNSHVGAVPGIKEFVAEFMSDNATGEEGYCIDKGLIPLPKADRTKMMKQANGLVAMTGKEKLK
jgi:phosphate transport system substrate-binding protein